MSHRIAVVAYEGAQLAAIYGLRDLLEEASSLDAKRTGNKRLEVLLLDAGEPLPDTSLTALILPPSLRDSLPQLTPELRRWLSARHAEGTVLCSVCVGAFLLGQLGVLDGRPATTHWQVGEAFAERHPKVALDTDRLVVDDGDIITAGGMMGWVDLGLRLIDRLLGSTTVLETARTFIVDPGVREQKFYRTFSPVLNHGDEAILRTQRWLQSRFHTNTKVPEMAAVAGLGQRTFLRRFQRATGLKSATYVQHLRVAKARELLESSQRSQQEIAWEVGYEDVGAFRNVFSRLMGLSPMEYRRRFAPQAPSARSSSENTAS